MTLPEKLIWSVLVVCTGGMVLIPLVAYVLLGDATARILQDTFPVKRKP